MKKTITLIALASGIALSAAAAEIEVNHLGTNNTMVRIDSDKHYLLMPVQESSEDDRIEVIVDGKLDQVIYVRLAKQRVDFSVPFDLSQYGGKPVLLNIVTSQSRSSVRQVSNDACWHKLAVTDTFDTTNREIYRPAYHHTPLYGWMNDPNGMFYKDGVWHLYYQWNPYGSKWQNMNWGHSTSTDLINWEHKPVAIAPDAIGTIFSGNTVVDHENTAGYGSDAIVSFYTSCGVSQVQSMAHSLDDGNTFIKYAGNPVITLDSEARDPNIVRYEPTGEWVLSLAHALEREILFYTSTDLKHWTLSSSFGKGIGCQDGVWECPDLFELPVEGSDESKWVLLVNINPGCPFGGSATQYFVGDFDGKTFTADTDTTGVIPTKWMDYGKDHYATVSFFDAPDNRRVVLGWMSNWQYAAEVPTMQYRSANTLPRDLRLFKGDDGQVYLASAPSPEVDALRGTLVSRCGHKRINNKKARTFLLPNTNSGICEIQVDLKAQAGAQATLSLRNANGEKVDIIYNKDLKTLSVDRRNSGIVDFSQDFPCVTTAPMHVDSEVLSLRIFVDRSSVEVFANNGEAVLTNLTFPTTPYTTIGVTATGKAEINNLKVYNLNVK